MHRVYVAWDVAEAKRFVTFLHDHGISGRVIEDRDFPSRGELHDAESTSEVWISDESVLERALALASDFETRRNGGPGGITTAAETVDDEKSDVPPAEK